MLLQSNDNLPVEEIEMLIDKLKYLTNNWSLAYDGKNVELTIDGSKQQFSSFVEAETFVEHELDRTDKWPALNVKSFVKSR